MKFGAYLINPPNLPYAAGDRSTEEVGGEAASVTSPGYLRECARYVEELGFDSIWFPDHVVIPASYSSRYPYQEYESGEYRRYPFDETAFPEPMTALAYVAGATDRIKLRTGVLILPERNPVLFAKELGTPRRALRRAARTGHRHRLAARGVRGARHLLAEPRTPLRRVHRGDARDLEQRRRQLRRRVRPRSRRSAATPSPCSPAAYR